MLSSSKKVDLYFNASSDLQTIFSKLKELKILEDNLSLYLDPAIKKYCCVANLLENRLTLMTANASIATELRFKIPTLLKQFRSDPLLKKIQAIHLKVGSSYFQAQKSSSSIHEKPMKRLSKETAQVVQQIAKSMKDKKLQDLLEKIASHVD